MVREIREKLIKTDTLWMFCEGPTETKYFKNLKAKERPRLNIRPRESGNTAKKIVEEALKFMENSNEFDDKRDIVACVFDRDKNRDEELSRVKKEAEDKNIMLVYSNPSFEYWILCHHEYNDSAFSPGKVYELVKNKMHIDAKKETQLYVKTKHNLDKAKTNAKRIKKKHEDNDVKLISRESNPLTLVYQIIERIEDFKVE